MLVLPCVLLSYIINLITIEEESNRKRRLSIQQAFEVQQHYPDYFEESEFAKRELFTMTRQLMLSTQQLLDANEKIHVHQETIKAFAGTGSKTIIRSFVELYLKQYEDKLWMNANDLVYNLFGSNAESKPLQMLKNTNDDYLAEMKYLGVDGNIYPIDNYFQRHVEQILFLRSVKRIRSSERKSKLLERISNEITIVSDLPNCTAVDANKVKEAIVDIYGILSDEIHQAGARFGANDEFLLPKAEAPITIPQIYALASIVQALGFRPVYGSL